MSDETRRLAGSGTSGPPDPRPTAELPGGEGRPTDPGRVTLTLVPAAGAPTQRYALLGELARGGMGVVYRAADAVLGREVAVKILQDRLGAGAARRFVDEARVTGQLQHPGTLGTAHDLDLIPFRGGNMVVYYLTVIGPIDVNHGEPGLVEPGHLRRLTPPGAGA